MSTKPDNKPAAPKSKGSVNGVIKGGGTDHRRGSNGSTTASGGSLPVSSLSPPMPTVKRPKQ